MTDRLLFGLIDLALIGIIAAAVTHVPSGVAQLIGAFLLAAPIGILIFQYEA